MNRKQFIESLGCTCRNWRWSWSFVNHVDRFVIFGAWEKYRQGQDWLILNPAWERSNLTGRRSSAFPEARHHVDLVDTQGYALKIFPMHHSPRDPSNPDGPARITGFEAKVIDAMLLMLNGEWFART
ncbi:MAG: hypothetical protein JJT81_10165 [Rubellimicrobium sp.]|nr:hypothetical protein [Rubellimicrobium sp.]